MSLADRIDRWQASISEAWNLARGSLRGNPARSALAITGVVIGIVTVVLVATVLVNLRNGIAMLFRELGTDNVFVFHLSGDPYRPPSLAERQRKPIDRDFAAVIARDGRSVRDVGATVLIPPTVNDRALTARYASNLSDNILIEGISANFLDITGAEFAAGRPFTDVEDRAGARVAILGAGLYKALFGAASEPADALGKEITFAGESYAVVGVLQPRRGGFFGENRQDRVLSIPAGTAERRFPEAENVVLYVRAQPGLIVEAQGEIESILRRLRRLAPEEPNDFNLSTSEQIIRTFDRVSAAIGLVTFALAVVSLFIGGLGIANVMIIAVFERTREIGVRRAVGARREDVLRQFLLEAALLSTSGGAAGVALAALISFVLALSLPGFSAKLPTWSVVSGLGVSCMTGILAGYLPARRAAFLDPVEALRHE